MPNPELQAQLERIEATLNEVQEKLTAEKNRATMEGVHIGSIAGHLAEQQLFLDATRRKYAELKHSSQFID